MITFIEGNLFEGVCDALINTVNCEGRQGSGLARQFADRYPAQNKEYMQMCKDGYLRPGILHIFIEVDGTTIINFPTKDLIYKDSELEYVRLGLEALKDFLVEHPAMSVAIPGLGTGLGNLDIDDVRPLIVAALEDLPNECHLYNMTPESNKTAQLLDRISKPFPWQE